MKCSKCGSTGIDKNICDDCMEDEVFKEMKTEVKAGAIACYFASPLALREQYKLETKKEAFQKRKFGYGTTIYSPIIEYVEWLEGKLCKDEGE